MSVFLLSIILRQSSQATFKQDYRRKQVLCCTQIDHLAFIKMKKITTNNKLDIKMPETNQAICLLFPLEDKNRQHNETTKQCNVAHTAYCVLQRGWHVYFHVAHASLYVLNVTENYNWFIDKRRLDSTHVHH